MKKRLLSVLAITVLLSTIASAGPIIFPKPKPVISPIYNPATGGNTGSFCGSRGC
jgi:hypothetical protein